MPSDASECMQMKDSKNKAKGLQQLIAATYLIQPGHSPQLILTDY